MRRSRQLIVHERKITPREVRSTKFLLGLRPSKSGRFANPKFSKKRGYCCAVETAGKIRSVPGSCEWRNYRDTTRLPLQLDRCLPFDERCGRGSSAVHG